MSSPIGFSGITQGIWVLHDGTEAAARLALIIVAAVTQHAFVFTLPFS